MPRTSEQYKKIREHSHARIKSAATQVFIKKGYAATSIQNIADYAQISVGLVYRYFDSKEHLFSSIVDEAEDSLYDAKAGFENSEDTLLTLQEVAKEILDHSDQSAADYMNLLSQILMYDEFHEHKKRIIKADFELFESVAKAIEKLQKEGKVILDDAKMLAMHFFMQLQGVVLMKSFFKEDYKIPTPKMIVSYLLKEKDNSHD